VCARIPRATPPALWQGADKRVANNGRLPGQNGLRSPSGLAKRESAADQPREKGGDVRCACEIRLVHTAHGAGRTFGEQRPTQYSLVLRKVLALKECK